MSTRSQGLVNEPRPSGLVMRHVEELPTGPIVENESLQDRASQVRPRQDDETRQGNRAKGHGKRGQDDDQLQRDEYREPCLVLFHE